MDRRIFAPAAVPLAALLIVAWCSAADAQECCVGAGPSSSYATVCWDIPADSLSACPAGDSLLFNRPAGLYPARLRVYVHYQNPTNCNPRVGVPPESIYVAYSIIAGNLKLNDKGTYVYADDSTNADGDTRITLPSFSGCGTIRLTLTVSGSSFGTKDCLVRTVDTDASGRRDEGHAEANCDLNYDGVANFLDALIANTHAEHWHRNVLHGTLVRRTNLKEDGTNPSIGQSVSSWSPNGRWIAFTIRIGGSGCKAFIAASDPKDGNQLRQFSFDSTGTTHWDYDPSWSPLGDQIVFDRDDWRILRKGIPGVSGVTDTSLILVTQSGSFDDHGDLTPAISPNGQWVAFSRIDLDDIAAPFNLWKIPIGGGTAKRLTRTSAQAITDFYPRWSPDGQWIVFDRRFPANPLLGLGETHGIFKVPADSGLVVQVYGPVEVHPDTIVATTPAWSPDGLIITAGRGIRRSHNAPVTTHTFDPTLLPAQMTPIQNYNESHFSDGGIDPILSPILSPDGTRLHLKSSKQIWVARRNMSLPPRITQVGSQGVVDSTAWVSINAAQGLSTSITVLSTDTESEPITCKAYFLEDGMTFNESTCKLDWTPSVSVGTKFYVRFQVTTASGGTDAIIAVLEVVSSLALGPEARESEMIQPDGPNPTRGRFVLTAPMAPGTTAQLSVFDLSGRRVALVRGRPGSTLVWDGRDRSGTLVTPGVYLYQLEAQGFLREGKVVIVR